MTVLFADLVGYTTVSETRDPELIQTILSLCFDRLSTEIKRLGGYVDKVVGDEIMALFGACAVPKLHPYPGVRRVANQDRRMPAEAPHTSFVVPMSPNRTWNPAPPSHSVIPCHGV